MTEKRPSLARKHTRQTKQNAEDFLNMGLELHIDGEHYEIKLGDLNGLDARELRRQVGMTFGQILDSIVNGGESTDIDHYAAAIWLARRVNGAETDLTYEEVLSETGYDVLVKAQEGAAAERKRVADEAKVAKKTTKKIAAVPDADAATA